MRIHNNQAYLNTVNSYAAASEKAISVRRAADERRKLTRAGASIDSTSNPEEASMIGRWMETRQGQTQSDAEYHTTAAGKDSAFG